jgi:3-hydroxypropanoate dehydrogenase
VTQPLSDVALDQLFRNARTVNKFTEREVDDTTLKQLYALYRWGPTSMNCQPGRVVFVRSAEAKERLMPALMPNNVAKTMAAPVTAIVAFDSAFFEELPAQFPAVPGARDMFASNPGLAAETAMRNGTLQGAYLILAARSMGLGAGPMSGFAAPLLDAAFFPDGLWTANFLVNLGWGDPTGNRPRGPLHSFGRLPYIK